MAKNNNARGKDTPIARAAREIATAHSKARNAVANGTTSQKRVTRSSGLLSLVAGVDERIEELANKPRGGRGDKVKPNAESDSEEFSDAATTGKRFTGQPSKAASDKGVSSDSETPRKRSLHTKAARKLGAHRGGQAASSDSDEIPAAKKKVRLVKRTNKAGDEATSSGEGDCSDGLTGELASQKIKGGGKDKKRDGSSDKLRELERKLKEAEEKNRILAKGPQKQNSLKMISKPKGSIGQKGYSLIEHMRLDPNNEDDKGLYNNILASIRTLAHAAGINFNMTYSEQPTVRLANLFLAAREKEPYLKRFSDDWATGEILRQFINGKRKGENSKTKQSEAEGGGLRKKRKGPSMGASSSNKRAKNGRSEGRMPSSDEEV